MLIIDTEQQLSSSLLFLALPFRYALFFFQYKLPPEILKEKCEMIRHVRVKSGNVSAANQQPVLIGWKKLKRRDR